MEGRERGKGGGTKIEEERNGEKDQEEDERKGTERGGGRAVGG